MTSELPNTVRKIVSSLGGIFFLIASSSGFALPFSIVPTTTLSPFVPSDCTFTANYTITNETASQRNNNYIKYLPPNVTQVTNAGGSTCGATFNLAPKGQAGDSCILQLTVSGAVDESDPNPHHHLFACFPGGLTCAGTDYPLNVTQVPSGSLLSIAVTPLAVTINTGSTQQYTAIGTYAGNITFDITSCALTTWQAINTAPPTAVASITATGLATAIAAGTSNIIATQGSIASNIATLTVPSVVYVGSHPSTFSVTSCTIAANGSITNYTACVAALGSTTISAAASSIAINPAGTAAYIANGTTSVYYCPINNNGGLGSCSLSPTTISGGGALSAVAIAINPSSGYAYIAVTGTSSVYFCPIISGILQPCTSTGIVTDTYQGIAIKNNVAYISSAAPESIVTNCAIENNGTFGTCNVNSGFSNPVGIAVNPSVTDAYIANFAGNTISKCIINPAGGTFESCSPLTLSPVASSPYGIAINGAGTYAYVTNSGNNEVYYCQLPNLTPCTAATGFTTAQAIAST